MSSKIADAYFEWGWLLFLELSIMSWFVKNGTPQYPLVMLGLLVCCAWGSHAYGYRYGYRKGFSDGAQ